MKIEGIIILGLAVALVAAAPVKDTTTEAVKGNHGEPGTTEAPEVPETTGQEMETTTTTTSSESSSSTTESSTSTMESSSATKEADTTVTSDKTSDQTSTDSSFTATVNVNFNFNFNSNGWGIHEPPRCLPQSLDERWKPLWRLELFRRRFVDCWPDVNRSCWGQVLQGQAKRLVRQLQ